MLIFVVEKSREGPLATVIMQSLDVRTCIVIFWQDPFFVHISILCTGNFNFSIGFKSFVTIADNVKVGLRSLTLP